MAAPTDDLAQMHASHQRLHATIVDLDDAAVRAPSRLPGWSRGHLLTHLARNADSVVRRLEGALRGELLTQYAGGTAGRTADIEGGADRNATELIADVLVADQHLDALIATLPDEAWAAPVLGLGGASMPASTLAFGRWREVEVHHVDLGRGYLSSDWPPALVQRWLPQLVDELDDRARPIELMAWLLGRGPAPELGAWG